MRRSSSAGAFIWSGLESASRQVLTLGLSLTILAFVTPHDLGVYALAFSFVLILALVVDVPISDALIQGAQATHDDWNTGFTVNLIIAAAAVALAWLASGLLAQGYHEPDLKFALPVLASSIVVGSLGNMQKAFMTRELQFGALTRIALAANTTGGVVALTLAAMGNGYWALLSNLVVTNIVSSTIYWHASPWKPRLALHRDSVARIWRFAGQSFLAQCVLQLREGALPIAIGWFGGTTLLGSFTLALRLSRTLGLFFEDLTRRPLFTLVSLMHHAREPTAPLLLDVVTLVGAIALPAFAGLALVGPVLTPLVFGARWIEGGHLLPLLCAIVLGWLTIHVPAVALRARGEPGLAVWSLLAPTLIDLVIIVAVMPFGVELALLLMAVRALLWLVPLGFVMQRLLNVPAARLMRCLRLPMLGLAAMTPAIELLRAHTGTGWGSLLLLITAGTAAYAITVALGLALGDRRMIGAVRALRAPRHAEGVA